MSRRKAREMALQALFQLDFNSTEATDALHLVFGENEKINEKAKEYTLQLVQGTKYHLEEIDKTISEVSSEWKLNRMTGVDRNIARIAVYEMMYSEEELPPNVVINEAVELAKSFGTEESSRFVNGILGSLVKHK